MLNPRLLSIFETAKDIRKKSCQECSSDNLSFDCPMVLCCDCGYEMFSYSENTKQYCKTCVGYMKKTCNAYNIINKKEEQKDGRKKRNTTT